jgi:hypothetical protein
MALEVSEKFQGTNENFEAAKVLSLYYKDIDQNEKIIQLYA